MAKLRFLSVALSRGRRFRGIAVALAVAFFSASIACNDVRDRLPPLPEFTYQNAASIARFNDADAAARREPSSENLGRLGMLYHAYRFHDRARACYLLARGASPEAFRWVYYQALNDKTSFEYESSESAFLRALEMRPDDAELWAELGDLYLMWSRREEAEARLSRALELDPLQPVASLGAARLLVLSQDWQGVIDLLTPLVARHPRLAKAHQYLAAAYGALGDFGRQAFHLEEGEYGSAVESPGVRTLNDLAVPAILDGDAASGPRVLQEKCARCHNHERIYDHNEDRQWWGRTVRRMQREAGWQWLTDDEAASVVAYLSERKPASRK